MHTLYSYRRCPYAMRARMALALARIPVQVVEISLRDKPAKMLELSPKGTVPVLQLTTGEVLEQSLDIMLWAFAQHDTQSCLMPAGTLEERDQAALIKDCDTEFKPLLDAYKYPQREHSIFGAAAPNVQALWRDTQGGYTQEQVFARRSWARDSAAAYLSQWDDRLSRSRYLLACRPTLADYALMPFVRQFAKVDESWFASQPWVHVQNWLAGMSSSSVFQYIMQKSLTQMTEPFCEGIASQA